MQKKVVSPKELGAFAKDIVIPIKPGTHAAVVALVGDLGAGKTTFTQNALKALGVKGPIISPTFLLIRSYPLKHAEFKRAYHIDCYRLENPRELLKLGLKEILKDPKNLVFVEWADRMKTLLPKNSTWIEIKHGKKKTDRHITHKN